MDRESPALDEGRADDAGRRGRLTASSATASCSRSLFTATRALAVLEHFRIPYRVTGSAASPGVEYLQPDGGGPALLWPAASVAAGPPIAARLDGLGGPAIPIFASIARDPQAQAILAEWGGRWTRAGAVSTASGQSLASVWRSEDGSVFLPFDPDEVRLNCLSERYREMLARPGSGWRTLAMHAFYRARPMLPRSMQIRLRRIYARVQMRTRFPRWPIETALHDFMDLLVRLVESIAGEPVPRIATWPNGSSWALVLTHDVETAAGLRAMEPVLELERSLRLRSCWNFVPGRYDVSSGVVESLLAEGFEVGVHGLYHDGRDLESLSMLRRRLPRMHEAAARWQAGGFRSPATHRSWDLMPHLDFDYDSSSPDTDPFEPQAGGCCTWLPFFNRGLVELPLTMPQDHTLFVILRHADEATWVQKMAFLRERGGMAVLDTHPDYLASREIFAAYQRLMDRFAGDEGAWRALPREVSDWWRRRDQSHLTRTPSGWVVTGPAADQARVDFGRPDGERLSDPAGV